MTQGEMFINDVTSEAFIIATENQSGRITINQLDTIIREHPYYEQVSLDTIEDYVVEVEQILEKNNRLLS